MPETVESPPHCTCHSRSPEPPWDQLDPGIRREVRVLWENGVHTTESCEGTRGHCYSEPTVRFAGDVTEGWRALGVALFNRLPVADLRRVWHVYDGEVNGPEWEMVFHHPGRGGTHPVSDANGDHTFEWGPIGDQPTRA